MLKHRTCPYRIAQFLKRGLGPHAVANSTGSIKVASSASAFELLTPALQIVVRNSFQTLGTRLTTKPRRELLLRQKRRHSIVDFCGQHVGLGDDYRAGL